MNKRELDLLEKVFGAECNLSLYQTQSKLAKKLEDEGYIVKDYKILGRDRFGEIKIEGYRTTLLGNMTYCYSGKCSEE